MLLSNNKNNNRNVLVKMHEFNSLNCSNSFKELSNNVFVFCNFIFNIAKMESLTRWVERDRFSLSESELILARDIDHGLR